MKELLTNKGDQQNSHLLKWSNRMIKESCERQGYSNYMDVNIREKYDEFLREGVRLPQVPS